MEGELLDREGNAGRRVLTIVIPSGAKDLARASGLFARRSDSGEQVLAPLGMTERPLRAEPEQPARDPTEQRNGGAPQGTPPLLPIGPARRPRSGNPTVSGIMYAVLLLAPGGVHGTLEDRVVPPLRRTAGPCRIPKSNPAPAFKPSLGLGVSGAQAVERGLAAVHAGTREQVRPNRVRTGEGEHRVGRATEHTGTAVHSVQAEVGVEDRVHLEPERTLPEASREKLRGAARPGAGAVGERASGYDHGPPPRPKPRPEPVRPAHRASRRDRRRHHGSCCSFGGHPSC